MLAAIAGNDGLSVHWNVLKNLGTEVLHYIVCPSPITFLNLSIPQIWRKKVCPLKVFATWGHFWFCTLCSSLPWFCINFWIHCLQWITVNSYRKSWILSWEKWSPDMSGVFFNCLILLALFKKASCDFWNIFRWHSNNCRYNPKITLLNTSKCANFV